MWEARRVRPGAETRSYPLKHDKNTDQRENLRDLGNVTK